MRERSPRPSCSTGRSAPDLDPVRHPLTPTHPHHLHQGIGQLGQVCARNHEPQGCAQLGEAQCSARLSVVGAGMWKRAALRTPGATRRLDWQADGNAPRVSTDPGAAQRQSSGATAPIEPMPTRSVAAAGLRSPDGGLASTQEPRTTVLIVQGHKFIMALRELLRLLGYSRFQRWSPRPPWAGDPRPTKRPDPIAHGFTPWHSR